MPALVAALPRRDATSLSQERTLRFCCLAHAAILRDREHDQLADDNGRVLGSYGDNNINGNRDGDSVPPAIGMK
jgi:hypothetical protein